MKTLNKTLIVTACFLAGMGATAQDQNDNQKREQVEKNTKAFSPSYFSNQENSIYVLEAMIMDNKIIIDSTATVTVVPGKLPYPNGNFKISILDKQGNRITDYVMQDPLMARSCEGEDKHLAILDTGRVFIPFPKNSNIGSLVFSRGKERVGTVDIGNLIIRAQREADASGQ